MTSVKLEQAFLCAKRNASEAGAGDGPGSNLFRFHPLRLFCQEVQNGK